MRTCPICAKSCLKSGHSVEAEQRRLGLLVAGQNGTYLAV